MGNPDVKPEKTVQYEIGYKQVLTDDLGFDLTIFYKDIRDLLGVEFIDTYNGAAVRAADQRRLRQRARHHPGARPPPARPGRARVDYTWQQALGNSSDPRETATRAAAGEDPRPRLVPFNWDQRHTINLTARAGQARTTTRSARSCEVGSGQPYTPQLEAGFGFGLEANSGRKPAGILVDLRAEKSLAVADAADLRSLFVRMFNLFDTRFFNGAVFTQHRQPLLLAVPGDRSQLRSQDPTRFYPPRRIEVGVRLGPDGLER